MGHHILIFSYTKLETRSLLTVDELFSDMENGIIFTSCSSILLHFSHTEPTVFRDPVSVVLCPPDSLSLRLCVAQTEAMAAAVNHQSTIQVIS